MINLCFLIRQLNEGGAQRQLMELVKGLQGSKFKITVITFYDGGFFVNEIKEFPSVRYISLAKRGRWDVFGFLLRLIELLRDIKPDILHGYMGTSNTLAVLLKPLFPRTKMVWGVRASNMDLSKYDWLVRVSYQLEKILSRFADLIIINSQSGLQYARGNGFPKDKMLVIPNGIDIGRFRPDPGARDTIRQEWGVMDGDFLFGLVGRIDPVKDHITFLKAAALLLKERTDVRYVCVGSGTDSDYLHEIKAIGEELGLGNRMIWAGSREDMPSVYNAFDVFTLCSLSEGFPNVVGEAMACGIPCVVTDVGDSAWVVADSGIVVKPGDPVSLVNGWKLMLNNLLKYHELSRRRIVSEFGTHRLIKKTADVLEGVL